MGGSASQLIIWPWQHDAAFRKCEVTYVPILLGGLMKTSNNQGPLSIPSR
jgi:2-hydroxychromene-2-carboxylate isomerase